MDVAEESEFARMHPNTTFHSGEIELVSDDADDASVNVCIIFFVDFFYFCFLHFCLITFRILRHL